MSDTMNKDINETKHLLAQENFKTKKIPVFEIVKCGFQPYGFILHQTNDMER